MDDRRKIIDDVLDDVLPWVKELDDAAKDELTAQDRPRKERD